MKNQDAELIRKRKKRTFVIIGIILVIAALSGLGKKDDSSNIAPAAQSNVSESGSQGILRLTVDTNFRGCATRPGIYLEKPNATIDWGDGSSPVKAEDGINRHSYPKGEYQITVKGTFERLGSGEQRQDVGQCFKSLDEWTADTNATSAESAFSNAVNLVSAAQPPTTVTSYEGMFWGAMLFNGDISSWDTSKVTDMSSMFFNASKFNQNIGNWNTASVTDMSDMFAGADDFNQNIGNWNVSRVETMEGMFSRAGQFNQNIGKWDTSKVREMCMMFGRARSFNQDISMWNVASVRTMTSMFDDARAMSANLTKWNVKEVKGNYKDFRKNNSLMVEPNWVNEAEFTSSC